MKDRGRERVKEREREREREKVAFTCTVRGHTATLQFTLILTMVGSVV